MSSPQSPRRNSAFATNNRNSGFANSQWQPAGPTLKLRNQSVGGPFRFMNPTTAVYDIKSNDKPGGTTADLADLTDAEKQERAKVRWNARDYRKGRHVLVLPRNAPLATKMGNRSSSHKVLLGIGRMFTMFPYWDVSWLIGISFTVGCLIFIACGLFYWLPIAYPETEFKGESSIAGGVSAFVGATLFQIGAVLLFLESYNDRAETQFGGAMEHLFVDRLKIGKRSRNHRPKHYDVATHDQNQRELAQQQTNESQGSNASSDSSSATEFDNELANIPTADRDEIKEIDDEMDHQFAERQWQWWPSWHDVRTHYIFEIGFLASFTMSVGATVFYICGILALPGIYNHLTEADLEGAYFFPYLLGGVLFALSSLLYILETQPNWYTPQPFKIGWHVGVWNMIGGIGWTIAASLGYCSASWCEYQSELSLIWASAAFSFGSALQWYESLDKYVVVIED